MTIYEILGIEEYLIDMPIPQDMILENIQYSSVSGKAETYFSVINNIILRASIQREDLELQIIEISLNEPRYIQEISYLIQTAIKYRILFVFFFDDRYLIVRRNFRLTASTDHVYSKNLSYTTGWIYQENLIADILCGYQSNDIEDDIDESNESMNYWEATDSKNRFYRVFRDILENIGQLNQCMIDCKVLSLRQFIDWYVGHSVKDRLEFLSIVETVIENNGMQFIEDTMFFEKNTIVYAIAELENSNYLRSVNYFSRHPFSYFDSTSALDVHDIENQIFHILYSEKHEESTNNSPQKACEKYIDNTIKNYFDTVGSYPLLKKAEEVWLLIAMQKGDKIAKEMLIKSNLRLVVSIAKRHVNKGLPLDDLIQEGTLGLIKALERHDISYDTRISTYATYWIEQAIQRALMDDGNLIRIPVHYAENIEKVRKAERELVIKSGDTPKISEISNHLKMSVKRVEEIKKSSTIFFEFDNSINEFGESAIDRVIDVENPTIFDQLYHKNLRESLEVVLKTLTPREERVLRLRFGLIDGRQRTLEEVGQIFNISRELIREIEAKALRKLRHPSRSKLLRDYLDCEDIRSEYITASGNDEDNGIFKTDSFSHSESFERGTKIQQNLDFEYRFAMAKIKNQIAEWKREFWMCLYDQEPLILQKIQNLYIEYFLFNKKLNEYMLANAGKAVNVINLAETWTVEKTRLIEQKRQAEEAARLAEEKRQAEEAAQYIEEILSSSKENDQTGELVRLTEEKRQIELLANQFPHAKYSIESNSTYFLRLPNIGSTLQYRLRAARIRTVREFFQLTTETVWDKLYAKDNSTHYFEIYSIEGARCNKKITELDSKRKDELKSYVDKRKGKLEVDPEDLTTLPNIGQVMSDRLICIGINTVSELDRARTEDVWDKLFQVSPTTDIAEIHLIECAKRRIKVGTLPESRKNELKQYVRTKKPIIEPGEMSKDNIDKSNNQKRQPEEATRLTEEKRRAEEAARIAEEKRRAEEAAHLAEEKRKAEEAARIAEEKRRAEEAARIAEEKRRAEEAARIAEEKRRAEEAARIAEEKRKAEEATRIAEEKRKAEEAARIAEEKCRAEEAVRLTEEKYKDQLMDIGLQTLNNCDDIIELTKAMTAIQTIGNWKRSKQIVHWLQEKINEEEQRALYRQQKVCQYCGGKFKGLFIKHCSVCNKPKDY